MFSSNSVLSVDGKIFAMLSRGRFVAKLPKERVDALVRSGASAYFDPGHGRLMKEWVAVRPGRADWIALAKDAYRYVRATLR
jgi:TfoX/Sxy family transcriptional regulator of competence genes